MSDNSNTPQLVLIEDSDGESRTIVRPSFPSIEAMQEAANAIGAIYCYESDYFGEDVAAFFVFASEAAAAKGNVLLAEIEAREKAETWARILIETPPPEFTAANYLDRFKLVMRGIEADKQRPSADQFPYTCRLLDQLGWGISAADYWRDSEG